MQKRGEEGRGRREAKKGGEEERGRREWREGASVIVDVVE